PQPIAASRTPAIAFSSGKRLGARGEAAVIYRLPDPSLVDRNTVAPAKAGVQGQLLQPCRPWIPAFAGTTEDRLFSLCQRLAVEPESLDLGSPAQLLQLGVDGVMSDQLAHLLARFLEARRLPGAVVLNLDHMPAELGLHRGLGVLPGGQGKGGVG